jgi:hypothetical protein
MKTIFHKLSDKLDKLADTARAAKETVRKHRQQIRRAVVAVTAAVMLAGLNTASTPNVNASVNGQ